VAIVIPWWLKIGAKLMLSRFPIGYRLFSSIGIFRHGQMDDSNYAIQVFSTHYDRSEFAAKGAAFVGLEIGVGDSVSSAIIARAYGASKCYLVDTSRYAVEDVNTYANVVAELNVRGLNVEGIRHASSIDELLARYKGIYLVEGTKSLMSIPDESIDFMWSQAVLEHIRVKEFDVAMAELYRIVKPDGILSHRVDLKDHLGGALNNRRIASKMWESEWMARSGFYTNRITYGDMLNRFENAGFSVEVLGVERWDSLPTPIRNMAQEFRGIEEDDLLVSGFDVLLRRRDIRKQ
jgi:SAM-dependent methyltransferase